MRRTLLAIAGAVLLTISSGVACAQDSVYLPLVVHSGDRLLIEYSHARNNNGQTKAGNVVAEIVIGDVGNDGFRATWTTNSVDVGGVRISTSSPQAVDFLIGVPIEYVADSDGTPVQVVDKEQLLDSLLNMPFFSSSNPGAIASVRSTLGSMSEEALAQLFLKVPSYMALCQGTNLPLGEHNDVAVQLPNPFGGEPVDAVVSYLLETFDEQRGKAQIEYRLMFDPESAGRVVAELLDQMAGPNKPPQSEIAGLSIERNDSASCEVSTEKGWAESVRFVTENIVLDQFKSDTLLISVSHSPMRSD